LRPDRSAWEEFAGAARELLASSSEALITIKGSPAAAKVTSPALCKQLEKSGRSFEIYIPILHRSLRRISFTTLYGVKLASTN
jgi:hypothetical protein